MSQSTSTGSPTAKDRLRREDYSSFRAKVTTVTNTKDQRNDLTSPPNRIQQTQLHMADTCRVPALSRVSRRQFSMQVEKSRHFEQGHRVAAKGDFSMSPFSPFPQRAVKQEAPAFTGAINYGPGSLLDAASFTANKPNEGYAFTFGHTTIPTTGSEPARSLSPLKVDQSGCFTAGLNPGSGSGSFRGYLPGLGISGLGATLAADAEILDPNDIEAMIRARSENRLIAYHENELKRLNNNSNALHLDGKSEQSPENPAQEEYAPSSALSNSHTSNTEHMTSLWSTEMGQNCSEPSSASPVNDENLPPPSGKAEAWFEKSRSFSLEGFMMLSFPEPFEGAYNMLEVMNPMQFVMPFGSQVVCVKVNIGENLIMGLQNRVWAFQVAVRDRIIKLCKDNGGSNVYFIFSVSGSKHFCGIAKVEAYHDDYVTDFWKGDIATYEGAFSLDWIYCKYVSFDHMKGIMGMKGESVTQMWNGMHYPEDIGRKVMQAYVEAPHVENMLAHASKMSQAVRVRGPQSYRKTASAQHKPHGIIGPASRPNGHQVPGQAIAKASQTDGATTALPDPAAATHARGRRLSMQPNGIRPPPPVFDLARAQGQQHQQSFSIKDQQDCKMPNMLYPDSAIRPAIPMPLPGAFKVNQQAPQSGPMPSMIHNDGVVRPAPQMPIPGAFAAARAANSAPIPSQARFGAHGPGGAGNGSVAMVPAMFAGIGPSAAMSQSAQHLGNGNTNTFFSLQPHHLQTQQFRSRELTAQQLQPRSIYSQPVQAQQLAPPPYDCKQINAALELAAKIAQADWLKQKSDEAQKEVEMLRVHQAGQAQLRLESQQVQGSQHDYLSQAQQAEQILQAQPRLFQTEEAAIHLSQAFAQAQQAGGVALPNQGCESMATYGIHAEHHSMPKLQINGPRASYQLHTNSLSLSPYSHYRYSPEQLQAIGAKACTTPSEQELYDKARTIVLDAQLSERRGGFSGLDHDVSPFSGRPRASTLTAGRSPHHISSEFESPNNFRHSTNTAGGSHSGKSTGANASSWLNNLLTGPGKSGKSTSSRGPHDFGR